MTVVQSWQNQFPMGSDVQFTNNLSNFSSLSVSHSESILVSLAGSFPLEPRGGVTVMCTAEHSSDKT